MCKNRAVTTTATQGLPCAPLLTNLAFAFLWSKTHPDVYHFPCPSVRIQRDSLTSPVHGEWQTFGLNTAPPGFEARSLPLQAFPGLPFCSSLRIECSSHSVVSLENPWNPLRGRCTWFLTHILKEDHVQPSPEGKARKPRGESLTAINVMFCISVQTKHYLESF